MSKFQIFLIVLYLFFFGAVGGWVLELLFRRFFSGANPERKWLNPGFLFGPCLPLYGFGTVLLFILMVALPVLTMKLFSEERKMRTEQLLLTAPVSIAKIVTAKFFAAFTVFFGANLLCSLAYITLFIYSEPEGGIILGNIIAITLVGAAFIAVGIFVSSLTENQLAAAIGTFGILLAMLGIGLLSSVIPWYPVRYVLGWFSILTRYSNFTNGFFDFAALFYYASVCFIFLFLTCRVLERRRYSA